MMRKKKVIEKILMIILLSSPVFWIYGITKYRLEFGTFKGLWSR